MTNKNQDKPKTADKSVFVKAAYGANAAGIGVRTWWRYHSMGLVPDCVRFGGVVRWRRSDVDLWISMGCPKLAEFNARKGAAK
jgi:predicted DNA-binding transcriptional regulator AlpA